MTVKSNLPLNSLSKIGIKSHDREKTDAIEKKTSFFRYENLSAKQKNNFQKPDPTILFEGLKTLYG